MRSLEFSVAAQPSLVSNLGKGKKNSFIRNFLLLDDFKFTSLKTFHLDPAHIFQPVYLRTHFFFLNLV